MLKFTRQICAGVPFSLIQVAKELQLDKAKHQNFVFSPCSIQLALSLVANGANGATLEEFLKHLDAENLSVLNSVATKLIGTLTKPREGPTLSFVGGVWLDQSLHLKQNFKTQADNIFKVMKVQAVDFSNEVKAKEAIDEVNEWAKEATNGLIESVLPKSSYHPNTKALLANALYFKGIWRAVFKKSLTKVSKFHLLNGETIEVPFMSSHENQRIDTFDDFKVLKLAYRECTLSMHVILPNETNGLWSIVEMMGSDPSFLDQYIREYPSVAQVGKFKLPKFSITCEIEKASEVLKSVGLELPFSDFAEFGEMVENSKEIKIKEVYHKSHIEVNEEGTEAAAATVVKILEYWGCPPPPPPVVDFVADHAFMFMVRDDLSGVVLFMGHVVNPLLE